MRPRRGRRARDGRRPGRHRHDGRLHSRRQKPARLCPSAARGRAQGRRGAPHRQRRPRLGHRRRAVGHRHGRVCLRHERSHRQSARRRHGLRRRPQQLPFRRRRLLRQPGGQSGHDRHGHGERQAEHGRAGIALGRAGFQPLRLRRAGRRGRPALPGHRLQRRGGRQNPRRGNSGPARPRRLAGGRRGRAHHRPGRLSPPIVAAALRGPQRLRLRRHGRNPQRHAQRRRGYGPGRELDVRRSRRCPLSTAPRSWPSTSAPCSPSTSSSSAWTR